jgi:hypothetical protein
MTIAIANAPTIKPIETVYRGNRFRSRLEARWAVFLDAAGIKWQYEPEGYAANGRRYLPDFWLPELKMFAETKPHTEACEEARETVKALANGSGYRCLLIAGPPNVEEPPPMALVFPDQPETSSDITHFRRRRREPPGSSSDATPLRRRNRYATSWRQCRYCDQVHIDDSQCSCTGPIKILDQPYVRSTGPRVAHAMAEAQRARFEHGEDGRPRRYVADKPTSQLNVYVAGSVIEDTIGTAGDGNTYSYPAVVPWRRDMWGDYPQVEDRRIGRFHYAGPAILGEHGVAIEDLAGNCLQEVRAAHVVFAWIDRPDTIGTIAEIGAAHALNKPIFVASADEQLRQQFYFAHQLATISVIAPTAQSAWDFFARWQNSWTNQR